MQYPPTPRIPTVPLPGTGAHHSSVSVSYGSNANDPPPSVHAILADGILCDAAAASTSESPNGAAMSRFTMADGRPLNARAVLDAPAALPPGIPCASVRFANPNGHLPAQIFIRSSGPFVTVGDVLLAVDAALQRRAPCAHDRLLGCPACARRYVDLLGARWVRVHVKCTSAGDFRVQLVPS